jgi:dCTP deaminase
VDLEPDKIGGLPVAAFEAIIPTGTAVQLELWKKSDKPQPWSFWRFQNADHHQRLQINKNSFYILRSRERLRLPAGVAAYCRAIDETIGEMRIHYAGFVHPFFGLNRGDGRTGTPLIFEVRGHDLNVSLIHREKLARLTFYRMSEDAKPDESAPDKTVYNEQELKLSSYFADWPKALTSSSDGAVSPKLVSEV